MPKGPEKVPRAQRHDPGQVAQRVGLRQMSVDVLDHPAFAPSWLDLHTELLPPGRRKPFSAPNIQEVTYQGLASRQASSFNRTPSNTAVCDGGREKKITRPNHTVEAGALDCSSGGWEC